MADPGDQPDPPAAPEPPTEPAPVDLSLAGLRRRYEANRSRYDILLIGAVALGGIVCMMVITAVVLVTQLRH